MAIMTLAETVVVFDLDDTLYRERDYQRSGIRAVCTMLAQTHGRDIEPELLAFADGGGTDVWAEACRLLALPGAMISSLLWTYRLHQPDITLDDVTRQTIFAARDICRAVAILTDGRSVTQRLKLHALGLSEFPCLVSEEYGSEKPGLARFQLLMRQFPGSQYVYVGDNPKKDFIAPNTLGWISIGLRLAGANVHPYDMAEIPTEAMPTFWIDHLGLLLDKVRTQ
jgi:putative hydrolase of the HAD superfamily